MKNTFDVIQLLINRVQFMGRLRCIYLVVTQARTKDSLHYCYINISSRQKRDLQFERSIESIKQPSTFCEPKQNFTVLIRNKIQPIFNYSEKYF